MILKNAVHDTDKDDMEKYINITDNEIINYF